MHHMLAQAIYEHYHSSTHTKIGTVVTGVLAFFLSIEKIRIELKQMTLMSVAMGTFDNKHVVMAQVLECCLKLQEFTDLLE